jgi:hypothetical protein
MKTRWRPGAGTVIGVACLVIIVAACTGAPGPGQPHKQARGQDVDQSHGLVVRAGNYAVTLTQVSPQSLGCTKAARTLHYALPCPAMLPSIVLGDYGTCSTTFMSANPCGTGQWRGWMTATGGINASGRAETPSTDEHFVMEATPFRTTNYNLIANGPVWASMGRPHTVQALGWITIGGSRMRWIYVSQNTQGSAMAGHIMLIWSAGPHTYALGFHNLWGKPLNEALDVAVAQHLRMVQP